RRGRRCEGRRVRPGRDARDANGDGEREGRDRLRMQLVAVAPRLDVNGVLRHGLALAGDGAAPLSADGRGRGNTTDAADARLIAEYAAREAPPAWQPPPPEVRELQGWCAVSPTWSRWPPGSRAGWPPPP